MAWATSHLMKGDELNTEWGQLVGMLWRQTLSNESEPIKFRRPTRQMWSPRWEPSFNHVEQFSNYIRAWRAHNVIPILWTKLEYDLILNSPNLNSWNWKWSLRFTKLFRQPISNFVYSTQDHKMHQIYVEKETKFPVNMK